MLDKRSLNLVLITVVLLFLSLFTYNLITEKIRQGKIDKCYREAYERYEEALTNIQDLPPERTNDSWVSVWSEENVKEKTELKEQLQKDEELCLERYK